MANEKNCFKFMKNVCGRNWIGNFHFSFDWLLGMEKVCTANHNLSNLIWNVNVDVCATTVKHFFSCHRQIKIFAEHITAAPAPS